VLLLERNCIIHAGTVVGSDGFGFASNRLGEHKKIYHIGNVVIEDDVEIGSNTSIDRAVFGTTRIQKGARLDNLIQVAHNCVFGNPVLQAQLSLVKTMSLEHNPVRQGILKSHRLTLLQHAVALQKASKRVEKLMLVFHLWIIKHGLKFRENLLDLSNKT